MNINIYMIITFPSSSCNKYTMSTVRFISTIDKFTTNTVLSQMGLNIHLLNCDNVYNKLLKLPAIIFGLYCQQNSNRLDLHVRGYESRSGSEILNLGIC